MCGYEDLRNGASSRPIEVRRDSAHGVLVGRYKFCMSPATDDPHDAITFTPALSVRARLCHFTGKLKPGNVLVSARRRSISTLPLQKVCAIECGTSHVNEDFIRP